MPSAQYNVNVTVAGVNFTKAATRTGDAELSYGKDGSIALPVAHALTNWVKTDADTAAGDLTAGHGLSTGTFDIYWDGGARYDVTCTITTNAVALDGGTGTDFPASANATVRMSPQTTVNTAIDGDSIQLIAIRLGYDAAATGERGRLLFEDAAGDDIADLKEADGIVASWGGAANERPKIYDIADTTVTNPFTGDVIATCKASQSSTSATADLTIALLTDSTP